MYDFMCCRNADANEQIFCNSLKFSRRFRFRNRSHEEESNTMLLSDVLFIFYQNAICGQMLLFVAIIAISFDVNTSNSASVSPAGFLDIQLGYSVQLMSRKPSMFSILAGIRTFP